MKITKIYIENFKYHQKLGINLNGNLLIYGENGTGKSSIYEAIKSNLYQNKISTKNKDIFDTYINRDKITENLKVNIQFDDDKFINRIDNLKSINYK